MKSTISDNAGALEKYKPTHEQFTYQKFPFYWIVKSANLYAQRMEKVLKKSGITITAWRVSMVLREHKSLSISELSKHCSFNPSTVTKTVYSMQAKNLLSVTQGVSDARISQVAITEQGMALINQLIANTHRIIDVALENFSEEELLKINALLEKAAINLSDY